MKSSYANYIFDFDGTIANLIVDWQECKNLVNNFCSKNNIAIDLSLSQKIVELGQISEHYLDLIYKLETCNGTANYSLIKPTINFIKSLRFVFKDMKHLTTLHGGIQTRMSDFSNFRAFCRRSGLFACHN